MPTISPPDYEERVLFMGTNGSGKSVLAREMLGAGYPRGVVIDVKGNFSLKQDFVVVRSPEDRKWRAFKSGWVVYRPEPPYNSGAELDDLLARLYMVARREGRKKPFIIYIDEALYLAKTGHVQALSQLAVTGRELRVGLWVASQRPKNIPVEVRSEAWRWYIFYLAYQDDEKEVMRYSKGRLSMDELEQGTSDYRFWEFRRQKGGHVSIRRFPPIATDL